MPIFKQRLLSRLMAAEGGEGGGGGGGSSITPEVQALIDSHVNSAVNGLKTKNGELLGKLKDATTNLQRFDGIDPDAVRTILSKFASDEEAGLIAKGDIDTVLNKRTERMQGEHAKAVKAEKDARERAEAKAAKLSAKALAGLLLEAAQGAHAEAKDDIVSRGAQIWRLDDDGNAVAMNGDDVVLGKDGKTPLTPKEWADSLRETAPHLWPKAQGSGANGSGPKHVAATEIFKLKPTDRMNAARAQRK